PPGPVDRAGIGRGDPCRHVLAPNAAAKEKAVSRSQRGRGGGSAPKQTQRPKKAVRSCKRYGRGFPESTLDSVTHTCGHRCDYWGDSPRISAQKPCQRRAGNALAPI